MNEQSKLFRQTPPPPAPKTVDQLGMGENHLMRLMLKTMYVRAMESPADLSEELKLHYTVVSQMLESAKDQKLVEIRSSKGPTRSRPPSTSARPRSPWRNTRPRLICST
jgi:hypothetical protein